MKETCKLYLISAHSMKIASIMAKEQGITSKEWVFIPWNPIEERSVRMHGHRTDRDHLLGYFTEEEQCLLCGKEIE